MVESDFARNMADLQSQADCSSFCFRIRSVKDSKGSFQKGCLKFLQSDPQPFLLWFVASRTEMRRKLTKSSCSKARHQGADVLQKKW